MKLHDLAAPQQTKQVAKVMESYFGQSVAFDKLTPTQARTMLKKVRGLIAEQRRQPDFHFSEQNPAYLKLMMMEQGLQAASVQADPAKSAALQTAQAQQAKRQIQDQIKDKTAQLTQLQQEIQQLRQQANNPTMPVQETRLARRLREASEVQQAQVVLASQDMVDQVQKMIEQTTSVQFKDLPALVDQIRNEVGYDQATQFNGDATAALSGLVQNLQQAKGQLEQALGVVTGQAPQIPGEELGAEVPEVPELPAGEEAELDIDTEEEPSSLETTLGRGKR